MSIGLVGLFLQSQIFAMSSSYRKKKRNKKLNIKYRLECHWDKRRHKKRLSKSGKNAMSQI